MNELDYKQGLIISSVVVSSAKVLSTRYKTKYEGSIQRKRFLFYLLSGECKEGEG